MRKLVIAAALLAAACTPSQSQQFPPHKFVTECRTTSFYGMVTTKCYEIDVTQRWLDYQARQHPLIREGDSQELIAAKKKVGAPDPVDMSKFNTANESDAVMTDRWNKHVACDRIKGTFNLQTLACTPPR